MYAMVPDSPAYTIGLDIGGVFYTGEQVWDIDMGFWRRAVEAVPPDEFVRPGVAHLGRSSLNAVGNVFTDSQDHYNELFIYPWAREDPVPDRIWPQSRPFPPDIVLAAGDMGEPTYEFGEHQAPFDGYMGFIGHPQIEGFSTTNYRRSFWADPEQYEQRGPGAGEVPGLIGSGTLNFDWAGWWTPGGFGEYWEFYGPQMMPHLGPGFIPARGHIREVIGDGVRLHDNGALRGFGPEDPELQLPRWQIYYRGGSASEGVLPAIPPYDVWPNDQSRAAHNRNRWLKDLAWQLAPGTFGGD